MDIKGLSKEEVSARIERGQTNKAPEKVTRSNLRIIFDNCFTLFNAFNAAIAVCLALVEAWLNMAFLLIIILNIAIGIVQEIHAKNLVKHLTLISAPRAKVLRDGSESLLPVEQLVLDDVIILSAGEQVPADSVMLGGSAEVNESLLTGESHPVFKNVGDELLSGSFLVGGKCFARVIRAGADNFASKITREAKKTKKQSSELLQAMATVTKWTSLIIVPVGALLFLEARFLHNYTDAKAVVSTAAALLGMLPKGLVLITTIALAAGVIKLSKKKVLVQQLHSIETLARVDMLCLDKTGTITEGKMRVSDFFDFGVKNIPLSAETLLNFFASASEDSNATINAIKERFHSGNTAPAVTALLPFSSERKFSLIALENLGTLVLGAPEKLSAELPANVLAAQNDGKRIVCAGYSPKKDGSGTDIPDGLVIFAAVALSDPIRKNAKETLEYFAREGVAIKVISGDNPLTVSLIAKEAGLSGAENYVDMLTVPENEISAAAVKYTVFGRVTPEQKKALVAALKAAGHTVAMTGDGVNDLPALREADCGIAMAGGSEAARQVAELVLTENDFTVLPDIVIEGRRVMNNITRVAGVFFVKTVYSVLLSVFCIIFARPFPFIPIQITLIDAAVEAYPSFFLSFEPDKKRIEEKFLPSVFKRALPYALMITLLVLLASFILPLFGISEETSQTGMYYLIGLLSILALFVSSAPFNRFRLFLCATSGLGFFAAAMLFAPLLELAPVSVELLLIVAAGAALSSLIIPIKKLTDKFFKKST